MSGSGAPRAELPIVTPPFEGGNDGTGDSADGNGSSADQRIGGVLLAAGTSSRFGGANKLLATVDGEPIVRRAARTLVAAGLDPIVVVLGHEAEAVHDRVAELPVETVYNDAYASGQASSVRAGISALAANDRIDAAVVALGDMPFVEPETIKTLITAYRAGHGEALAPAYDGDRGNPVLFDRRFFEPLADVSGDTGGRAILLDSDASALVAVDDPGVRRDIDDRGDLPSA